MKKTKQRVKIGNAWVQTFPETRSEVVVRPNTRTVENTLLDLETAVSEMKTPLHYVGIWNPITNNPVLKNPDPELIGGVYRVSVAGTCFGIEWKVGDKLVYNENGNVEQWDVNDEVTLADLENLITALAGKQDKPPMDGKKYLLKDGGLYEFDVTEVIGILAENITVDSSSFNNLLTVNANTVQKALEELDQALEAISGAEILEFFN